MSAGAIGRFMPPVVTLDHVAEMIEHYWVVSRNVAQTVVLYRLGFAEAYEEQARVPLARLLQTKPEDHRGA